MIPGRGTPCIRLQTSRVQRQADNARRRTETTIPLIGQELIAGFGGRVVLVA